MENKTQSIIVSDMYALRAGISAISIQAEKIENTWNNYRAKNTDKINEVGRNCRYECINNSREERFLDGGELQSAKEKKKSAFINSFITLLILIGLSAIFIFTVVTIVNCINFLITCNWVSNISDDEMNQMLAGIGVTILAGIGGIASLIGIFIDFSFIKSNIRNIKSASAFINQYPTLVKYLQETIENRNSKILPEIQACEQLYSLLRNLFSNWIDERDWQYLDLLIYYCETHRADSLKEALLLLEREIQTQRIIGAIEAATEQICGTLRQGFATLGQAINNLTNQILITQKIQSAQLANLTNAVNLNNALQAKANVTSTQLMSDVNALRNNSDYATLRLKQVY